LLKPLEEMIEDGDYIYAIVKGSAINHSERTRTLPILEAWFGAGSLLWGIS
jgi:acyl transferase domain-containing protein